MKATSSLMIFLSVSYLLCSKYGKAIQYSCCTLHKNSYWGTGHTKNWTNQSIYLDPPPTPPATSLFLSVQNNNVPYRPNIFQKYMLCGSPLKMDLFFYCFLKYKRRRIYPTRTIKLMFLHTFQFLLFYAIPVVKDCVKEADIILS